MQKPANQIQTKSQRLTPEPTVRTRSRDKCPLLVPVNLKAWKANARAATLSIYNDHITYDTSLYIEIQLQRSNTSSNYCCCFPFHMSRFGFHSGLSSLTDDQVERPLTTHHNPISLAGAKKNPEQIMKILQDLRWG